jgi:nucleoside-diphosphate-sugar epimerase
MKIFITGSTGYIGYAVARELARNAHEVFGLARTQEKARMLSAAEVLPVMGDMREPESYAEAAREADVLIHCAAEYSAAYMELDRATVRGLIETARSTGRPRLILYTSGCWLLGNTGPLAADETSPLRPPAMVAPRAETEKIVLEASGKKLRTIVLRPGCVYGGSGGLTGAWFESAQKEGAARIAGDGNFHWTMVHVADLAVAYRRAAESDLEGEVFNLSDHSHASVRECAGAASLVVTGTDRVVTTPAEEAIASMGPVAECLMLDQHVDSAKATRLLGWNPAHTGFVDGVRRYYESWKASR